MLYTHLKSFRSSFHFVPLRFVEPQNRSDKPHNLINSGWKPWAQPQGPRKTPTSIPDFAFHWLFLVPHHRISHFNPTYSVVPHSICSMCHLDNWSESCVFTAPDRTFLIARLEYFQYVFKCIPHRSTFLFSLVLRQMNKFLVAKREKKTENKKKKDKWKKKKSRVEKLQIFFVAPLGLPVAFLFYIRCTAF